MGNRRLAALGFRHFQMRIGFGHQPVDRIDPGKGGRLRGGKVGRDGNGQRGDSIVERRAQRRLGAGVELRFRLQRREFALQRRLGGVRQAVGGHRDGINRRGEGGGRAAADHQGGRIGAADLDDPGAGALQFFTHLRCGGDRRFCHEGGFGRQGRRFVGHRRRIFIWRVEGGRVFSGQVFSSALIRCCGRSFLGLVDERHIARNLRLRGVGEAGGDAVIYRAGQIETVVEISFRHIQRPGRGRVRLGQAGHCGEDAVGAIVGLRFRHVGFWFHNVGFRHGGPEVETIQSIRSGGGKVDQMIGVFDHFARQAFAVEPVGGCRFRDIRRSGGLIGSLGQESRNFRIHFGHRFGGGIILRNLIDSGDQGLLGGVGLGFRKGFGILWHELIDKHDHHEVRRGGVRLIRVCPIQRAKIGKIRIGADVFGQIGTNHRNNAVFDILIFGVGFDGRQGSGGGDGNRDGGARRFDDLGGPQAGQALGGGFNPGGGFGRDTGGEAGGEAGGGKGRGGGDRRKQRRRRVGADRCGDSCVWPCFGRQRVAGAQDHAVFLNLCLDPAVNFALGNLVQHRGIGNRRFGPEIAVPCGQIAEILGNRPHRVERVVKPLQSAGKGSVGNG